MDETAAVQSRRTLEGAKGALLMGGSGFARRAGLLVLCVAGAVHGLALGAVRVRTGSLETYAFRSLDSWEYYNLALNIEKNGTFSQRSAPPYEPDTWRTPGYPLFLVMLISILGAGATRLVIAQHVIAALSAWLLFQVARPHLGGRRAMVASLLFLLEPYHLYYAFWLMSETLFVALLLLAWYAWDRAHAGQGSAWYALTGLLTGMLVLVRPVALLLPATLVITTIILSLRTSVPAAGRLSGLVRGPLVFALTCGLTVGNWMARNRIVADHFALSSQGGVVLAYFKATEVELWRTGQAANRYLETSLDPAHLEDPHPVWESIDTQLRDRLSYLPAEQRDQLRWPNLAQGNRTSVDSFEISRALGSIGWSAIAGHPSAAISCSAVRCGELLAFPLSLAVTWHAGISVNRVRAGAIGAAYALLSIACAARLLRGRATLRSIGFPMACAFALLLMTTPQLDPRLRLPLIPLMLVIALLSNRPASGEAAQAGTDTQ